MIDRPVRCPNLANESVKFATQKKVSTIPLTSDAKRKNKIVHIVKNPIIGNGNLGRSSFSVTIKNC